MIHRFVVTFECDQETVACGPTQSERVEQIWRELDDVPVINKLPASFVEYKDMAGSYAPNGYMIVLEFEYDGTLEEFSELMQYGYDGPGMPLSGIHTIA